jgi:hypothetical protein
MLGLCVSGVIIVLVLGGLWSLFERTIPEDARVPAWAGPRELPPTPRLQIAPTADLAEYRQQERQRLNSYGWVDKSSGKVHIPIDKAIERIVSTGLPARQQKPAAQGSGNIESGRR